MSYLFCLSNSDYLSNKNPNLNNNSNTWNIEGNLDLTGLIVKELDKLNPNWKDNFIISPLENSKPLIQFLIDNLTNQLIFNIIIVYLLLMLLIILIGNLLINKDNKFSTLKTYPFGFYFSNLLVKLFSFLHVS